MEYIVTRSRMIYALILGVIAATILAAMLLITYRTTCACGPDVNSSNANVEEADTN